MSAVVMRAAGVAGGAARPKPKPRAEPAFRASGWNVENAGGGQSIGGKIKKDPWLHFVQKRWSVAVLGHGDNHGAGAPTPPVRVGIYKRAHWSLRIRWRRWRFAAGTLRLLSVTVLGAPCGGVDVGEGRCVLAGEDVDIGHRPQCCEVHALVRRRQHRRPEPQPPPARPHTGSRAADWVPGSRWFEGFEPVMTEIPRRFCMFVLITNTSD